MCGYLYYFTPCRFAKKDMILTGLWCSKEKPRMNILLHPLIDAANELYRKGIQFSEYMH